MTNKLFFALLMVFLIMGKTPLMAQITDNLYFVFLNTNPDREKLPDDRVAQLQDAHLKNIGQLHSEKKLLAAGPFDGGGGMFVLQANSLDEAKDLLKTDPAISANRFIIEVLPFQIEKGLLRGADSIYEMTTVQFVRFTHRQDFSGDEAATIALSMPYVEELFDENPSILVYGTFSNHLDGMLMIENTTREDAQKLANAHPAVQAGMISYYVVPLYIAKETFTHQ